MNKSIELRFDTIPDTYGPMMVLRCANGLNRTIAIAGEVEIEDLKGCAYDQPRRGPYPLYFSGAGRVARIVAGGSGFAIISRDLLTNIQEDRKEVALITTYGDKEGIYLNDPSGRFLLRISVWLESGALYRFFKIRQRRYFPAMVYGPKWHHSADFSIKNYDTTDHYAS